MKAITNTPSKDYSLKVFSVIGMAAHTLAEKRLQRLLKELREEAGLTQVDLGKRIKQPQQVVSKIERGERRLYATQLFEICKKGFGIGPAEFCQRYEKAK